MGLQKNDIEIIFSRLRKYLLKEDDFFELYALKSSNNRYSIIKFILGKGNKHKALISAGIHGDEPSGVETICKFLENNQFKKFSEEWELTFLPCLNPYGYEYESRENHEGKDLNRFFKDFNPPEEVTFAKSSLENPYHITIELHEDFMSSGYYLYQLGNYPEDVYLGSKILQAVKQVMPINLDSEIDGNSAEEGIIIHQSDFKSMDWWPMAYYSLYKGTRMCLTLETSTKFSMELRIKAHLIAINTALTYFSDKK
jgi:murein peptide amidase A